MTETPDNSAPTPPEACRTEVHIHDPATVVFHEHDDGRWFRVLNWLTDSGVWAGMTDAMRSVLIVLLRHRDRGGLARIATAELARQAGLSVRGTQNALKQLSEHPAALLAWHGSGGAGAWEPLPERHWAGRASPCAEAHAHALERTGMRESGGRARFGSSGFGFEEPRDRFPPPPSPL